MIYSLPNALLSPLLLTEWLGVAELTMPHVRISPKPPAEWEYFPTSFSYTPPHSAI